MESADGTRIRAWCNDADGRPVLLSNGLGTPPAAWPSFADVDCGFRVVTWYHRGLGGSDKPSDVERRRVEDHTQDALAVMDAFEMPSALVVGWSLGVNVTFELVREHPERIQGVLAVAGVPGGSFESMFAPLGVPRRFRAATARAGAGLLKVYGPLLPFLTATLPRGRSLPFGLIGPAREATHGHALLDVLHEFSRHDWSWFHDLAVAMAEHAPLDVSSATMPVTVVAGLHDALVDVVDMRAMAASLGDARYRELAGTHYIPLQYPEVMLDELRQLAVRVDSRRS